MAATPVLFDVDGTLVDTVYLHTVAWWRALDDAGRTMPMAAIHPLIGMGGDELLTVLLGEPDEAVSRAHGQYFAASHSAIRALPGALELLARVQRDGRAAVVVTSAKERDLPALLGPLGGAGRFDEIVHGSMVGQAKPAPHGFTVALRQLGAEAADVVALGDSQWDIEAARRAGVGCVAVGTGGSPLSVLAAAGAMATYPDCRAIVASWDRHPLRPGPPPEPLAGDGVGITVPGAVG